MASSAAERVEYVGHDDARLAVVDFTMSRRIVVNSVVEEETTHGLARRGPS